MALSESFFESLVAGDQKISLASLSPKLRPFRHLEGSLAWDPSLLFNASGTYRGPPWLGFYSVVQCLQVFDGLASLVFSCQMLACGDREATVMAPLPVCDSAVSPCFHSCLAFFYRHFCHSLLPHIPSIHLSSVNSSLCPGIAPQSLNSSSKPLCFPGYLCPCWGYVWLWRGQILIPFRLPQISCFTLSLKCFSSDSENCPIMGIGPLLQFPHQPREGPVLLTLLFSPLVPSSYRVLRGPIYSFPLVRYSCLLSAGVLHALLCLKVYSWCIRGERCSPHPATPLSCSLLVNSFDHTLRTPALCAINEE